MVSPFEHLQYWELLIAGASIIRSGSALVGQTETKNWIKNVLALFENCAYQILVLQISSSYDINTTLLVFLKSYITSKTTDLYLKYY